MDIDDKQEDEEDPITSMEIRIQDQDGVSITDAINVYLYTDLVQYNTAKSNENVLGTSFYTSGISMSGSVTFDNVDPSLTYYVFIKYNNNGYDLTNYFSQYEIKNTLQADKKTVLLIKLEPYKIANIGFYSLAAENLKGDPIKIYFGDEPNSVGTIELPLLTSIPTDIDDAGVVKVLYQNQGVYNWSATGASGCHWQGTVNVTTNSTSVTFIRVPLNGCNNGIYSFWSNADDLSKAGGSILVVLDNVDTVGYINSSRESAPNDCNDPGQLVISRPKSSTVPYRYHAYSKNKNCSWNGEFTMITEDCTVIPNKELKGCD